MENAGLISMQLWKHFVPVNTAQMIGPYFAYQPDCQEN